jgi:hypothetical protein
MQLIGLPVSHSRYFIFVMAFPAYAMLIRSAIWTLSHPVYARKSSVCRSGFPVELGRLAADCRFGVPPGALDARKATCWI